MVQLKEQEEHDVEAAHDSQGPQDDASAGKATPTLEVRTTRHAAAQQQQQPPHSPSGSKGHGAKAKAPQQDVAVDRWEGRFIATSAWCQLFSP